MSLGRKFNSIRLVFWMFGTWLSATQSYALMGLGSFVSDQGEYQKNDRGQKQILEFAPYTSFHHGWKFGTRWEFTPEVAFVFHRSPSPNHSRMTFLLLYPLNWTFYPRNHMRLGFGNLINRIAGKGGSVLMNNGNGYSFFSQPSGAQYSSLATILLGYEFRLRDYLGFRFDILWAPIWVTPMKLSFGLSTNLYYF